MCSARDNAALPALGFPIRASAGQRLFSASSRLIAAVHALHRLLVPRHPPCALTILTVIFWEEIRPGARRCRPRGRQRHPWGSPPGDTRLHWLLCSFQGPRGGANARHGARDTGSAGHQRRAGLSKLSSMQPAPRERGPALQARSTFLVRMLCELSGRPEASNRGARLARRCAGRRSGRPPMRAP